MFCAVAVITQVQEHHDYNKFFVQASVTLTEDFDYAELQLKDVDLSVRAAPLINAKSGPNTFYISGSGYSPFKVGDTIPAVCFPISKLAQADMKTLSKNQGAFAV
jgi:hypothetical protein